MPCPPESPALLRGSPGLSPGATHVEDGEEHQDGDLEHADLHCNAVPNLDAVEEGQLRAQSGGEKTPKHRAQPSSDTIFWVTKSPWGQADTDLTHQWLGSPKLLLGAISPQAQIVLQGKLDSIDNLWQLRHHRQHRDTDEILQGRGDISLASCAEHLSSFYPHCSQGRGQLGDTARASSPVRWWSW